MDSMIDVLPFSVSDVCM